jgi:hypothetical protein
MNMAIGDFDPIQTVVEGFIDSFVHDKWFMRRLPKLTKGAGFEGVAIGPQGYIKLSDPKYLRTGRLTLQPRPKLSASALW